MSLYLIKSLKKLLEKNIKENQGFFKGSELLIPPPTLN